MLTNYGHIKFSQYPHARSLVDMFGCLRPNEFIVPLLMVVNMAEFLGVYVAAFANISLSGRLVTASFIVFYVIVIFSVMHVIAIVVDNKYFKLLTLAW